MNRRDLLSSAATVGAGALILGAQGGISPVLAGTGGLLFQGCKGKAYNKDVDKSGDEDSYFECDLKCEPSPGNVYCKEGKLFFVVTLSKCVIHYKRGKGQGKGEWKTVKCPDGQKALLPCGDFDKDNLILSCLPFNCKDEDGRDWKCAPNSIDCKKSLDNKGCKELIAIIIAIFVKLKLDANNPCTTECGQILKLFAVIIVVIVIFATYPPHHRRA
jgi:hypothetical protein